MDERTLEQRARELLAAEYERSSYPLAARNIVRGVGYQFETRAIAEALRQQLPAPAPKPNLWGAVTDSYVGDTSALEAACRNDGWNDCLEAMAVQAAPDGWIITYHWKTPQTRFTTDPAEAEKYGTEYSNTTVRPVRYIGPPSAQAPPGAVDEQTNEWPNLATAKRAAYFWSNEACELRRKLDAAIASNHVTQPVVDDDQCIAVYDAVMRSGITRDVKTPARKVEIVRAALEAAFGGKP